MEILISIVLFIIGAAMGSFACCQAWRLHKGDKSRRSHCMSCDYKLRWYDNIPIVSWLLLRGRCRKCRKAIGPAEILSEIALAILFVLSYFLWPERMGGSAETLWNWALFALFLVLLVGLAILFVSDAKWGKLPTNVLTFCAICAIMILSLRIGVLFSDSQFSSGGAFSLIGALILLPGLYFLLYKLSNEKWVGGGDWLVALAIALVLGDWWLALCTVFIANLLGSIVGLVSMKKQGKTVKMRIAFGPFLILAFLIIFFVQDWLLSILVF